MRRGKSTTDILLHSEREAQVLRILWMRSNCHCQKRVSTEREDEMMLMMVKMLLVGEDGVQEKMLKKSCFFCW